MAIHISMFIITPSIPMVFFSDLHILNTKMNSDVGRVIIGISFPDWSLHIGQIGSWLTFGFIMYLTTYKWLNITTQYIICIHHSTIWISQSTSNATMHKSMYVFIKLFNEFFNTPLIMFTVVIITMEVSFAFTICLIGGISLLSFALFILAIMLLASLKVALSMGKSIFTSSEETLYELRHGRKMISPYKKKFLHALVECRIYCGSLYFIDAGVLRSVNEVILPATL